MRSRMLLSGVTVVGVVAALAAPALAQDPPSAPTDLLVPAAVLERLDLVPVSSDPTPLPDELTCRHLEAAQTEADTGSSPASVATQRSASDDDRVQLLNAVRVFPDPEAARAYQRVFRAEDPTEECFEFFLASQQTDDDDIRADDRGGVKLDGAVTVAYLAGANFDDDDLAVKAEALIARKGAVVIETFFLAPDDDEFADRARTVQRSLTSIFRSLPAQDPNV